MLRHSGERCPLTCGFAPTPHPHAFGRITPIALGRIAFRRFPRERSPLNANEFGA